MRFHLDAYADDLVRFGVPRREALRHARIHFGSVEGVKDDCRQARGLRLVDEIVQTRTGDDETALRIPVQDVTLGYFATLGIPLSAGRLFDVRDGPDAPRVAIVNESAARLLFGSPEDALGRRLRIADDTWRDVAGVVGDTRSAFFNTLEWVTNPVVYLPAPQAFDAIRDPTVRSFPLHLQIESDAPLSVADVRRAVAELNTRVAVMETRPAANVIAAAVRQPAFRMWLLGGLALVSLLLAAIGVYGIVSQRVAHRTREIGIRLALGAAPGRVGVAVTIRTLLTVAVGAVCGCAAAMGCRPRSRPCSTASVPVTSCRSRRRSRPS